MSAVALEISNACRTFADSQGLTDVSLNVDAGEIVALLGPNGAGKTTLIRAATGQLLLDSGSVRVAGLDPAARRALGIVPQTIALYPQLSGRENLDIFARLMGLKGKAIGRAVDEALRRAGLQDRADELLTQLSGGMQRRLNIVAGALHGPKLLLLDEPTVGVDLHARESIQVLLRELRDAGIAILVSTHDFEQAASLADRAAFMASGRLLRVGPVSALIYSVFGDAKEGSVSLARPASGEVVLILRNFKLRPALDKQLWSGPLQGGYAELAMLEAQLEQAGAHVAETRLRDPGLAGVFLHMQGEGSDT